MPTLQVSSLRKSYGSTLAVDDLTFSTAPGEIVGLLGPNGAGKTTTINMILGVLEPSGGRIHIEGRSLATDRREALPRQLSERFKAPQLAARPPVDLAELAVEHEGLGDGHDEKVRRYVPRLVADDGDLHAVAPGGHQ